MSAPPERGRAAVLGDPELRTALLRFVRGRVPQGDVEDVVQAALIDAVAAERAPDDPVEIRKWVHGIARHKIADHYRKKGRDPIPDSSPADHAVADSEPLSARDLLRWAERELPEGEAAKSTLEWMIREGTGEKLESIAKEEDVPAPRVRQRVTRMRKHFRARWAAQAAAIVALAIVAGWWFSRETATMLPEHEIVRELPREPKPAERAEELRRAALDDCEAERWQQCLEGLDDAKRLDPAGDRAPEVERAREAADRGLAPPNAPTSESETKAPVPDKGAEAPVIDEAPIQRKAAPRAPLKIDPKTAPKVDPKQVAPNAAPKPSPLPQKQNPKFEEKYFDQTQIESGKKK